MWQASHWARKALASSTDRILDKLDAGKLMDRFCKDKAGKSFIIPASQKSLSGVLSQRLKMMLQRYIKIVCDYPGNLVVSAISVVLEGVSSWLPIYSATIYPSQVSDGFED